MIMTHIQIQKAQATLRLTNKQFADLLGTTVRTVERWRAGTQVIPEPISRLIKMLIWLYQDYPAVYGRVIRHNMQFKEMEK